MHYIIKGIEIRSENSAKPMANAAASLVSWLSSRQFTPSALDFGCGKLRYTHYLAGKSERLGVVDSDVQLNRFQAVDGEYTSVKTYIQRKWPACAIHELKAFWKNASYYYHFVLCANVLSAVPCPNARAKSLRSIYTALPESGQVLFVNQHTNSYFTQARNNPRALMHLDGWIAQSRATASYYGILNKESVIRIIGRFGFVVEEAWVDGQSNYVLASKGRS
jgi:hypothetical protein